MASHTCRNSHKKRYDYFHMFTSSRCRVSVGQHCKCIISLVILKVQTVLRNYQVSRNLLFLSNKKSWWRELNPWPLPYQGSALPLSHISIVSDLPLTFGYVTRTCLYCQSLFFNFLIFIFDFIQISFYFWYCSSCSLILVRIRCNALSMDLGVFPMIRAISPYPFPAR